MEHLVYQSPNWFVNLKGKSSSAPTANANQTKSVKSSTVDTSLFLCPVASGFPADALCCIDLFCWLCPCVTEIPGVGRDWISSWAWARIGRVNCVKTLAAATSVALCFLTLVLILLMCRSLASHLEAYASEGLALYWCTREAICREEKVRRGLGVRDFQEKEGGSYVCM